jgi:transglutaminase-like putative cysteine protease
MPPALRLVTALTVVAGCTHWEPLPPAARPSPSDHPNAAALLLDDDLEVYCHVDRLSGRPVIDETWHRRAFVLREGGGDAVAEVQIPYEPEFSTVTSFAAHVVTPDGREHDFGPSDLVDAPVVGGMALYSSTRVQAVRLTPAGPGTLVEYRYTVRDTDWRATRIAQRFEGALPVQHARLTVIAPTGWQLAWTAMRRNQRIDLPPAIRTEGGGTRMIWEQRDLPALPSEPFAAGRAELATQVGVRLVRWTELGQEMRAPTDAAGLSAWLYKLTVAPDGGARPRELARQLVAGDPPDVTVRARHLYNWVRDHISYCAIEIGIGGLRPHAAGDVERLHYGDCKDKANLLHEMLAAVDIPSYLVTLYAHDGLPLPLDPVAWLTNHAILAVRLPGGDLLVDPTSRATPFGALPASDQEAEYLSLVDAGQPVRQAPGSSPQDNAQELLLDLAPSGDDLRGTFRSTVQGAPADELRAELIALPRGRYAKPLASLLHTSTHHLLSWDIENGDPPDEARPVTVTGKIALQHGWPRVGLHLVTLAALLGDSVPTLPRGPRQGPLVFRWRRVESEKVQLALADDATVSLPPPTLLERSFGRYQLTWSRADGKLVASRALELREHVFGPERYAEVKQFFDDILAAEARAVTIRGGAL